MIFAVFEQKSIKGSHRFRVISALVSRKNKSLVEISGKCRHSAEQIDQLVDRPTSVSCWCSVDISSSAPTILELIALFSRENEPEAEISGGLRRLAEVT
jgi:hypothetical protein